MGMGGTCRAKCMATRIALGPRTWRLSGPRRPLAHLALSLPHLRAPRAQARASHASVKAEVAAMREELATAVEASAGLKAKVGARCTPPPQKGL